MTEDMPRESSSQSAPRARSKRGVPRFDLAVAEEAANKLWGSARSGVVTEDVLARAWIGENAKASGGRWRTRIAGLRAWGVVSTPSSGNVQLSPLGLALVNSSQPEAQAEARRKAVLNVEPFAQVLDDCDGTPLPDRTGLEGRFEFGYSMGKTDAKKAAQDFAASVESAGFLDSDGVVRLSPQEHQQVLEDEADAAEDVLEPADSEEPMGTEQAIAQMTETSRDRATAPSDGHATHPIAMPSTALGGNGASLAVTLDMSDWDVDDVIKVCAALGFGRSVA